MGQLTQSIFRCFAVILWLATGFVPAAGQGWLNTYDNFFYLYKILPDSAGGYYLGGFEQTDATQSAAVVSKINDEGELLWKRDFLPGARATGLVRMPDGRLAALTRKAGSSIALDSIHLTILHPQGSIEATYFVKETGNIDPFPSGDMHPLPSGRLVSAGMENVLSNSSGTIWAMTPAGQIVWQRDSIDMVRVFDALVQDNRTVLAGRVRYPGQIEQDGILFFDSLGNTVDALVYPPFAGSAALSRLPDGWLFYTANATFDAVVRRISATGVTTWTIQDTSLVSESALIHSDSHHDGFYISGISRADDFLGQSVLQHYDQNGLMVRRHQIKLPGYEQKSLYLTAMAPARDGGFIIAGGITLSSSLTRYFTAKIDSTGQVFEHHIIGQVFSDNNQNCLFDTGEQRLERHKIRVSNLTQQTESVYWTDAEGRFELVSDNDSLVLEVLPPNPYWKNTCFDAWSLVISPDLPADTTWLAFPMTAVVDCGFLEVDMGTTTLQCGGNSYSIQSCNTGTIPVDAAYVVVALDPDMDLLEAERPFEALSGNTFQFDLDPLAVGECTSFTANIFLDCGATTLEETHCVNAHIYPDTFCLAGLDWSGAFVEVSGACVGDSVQFLIQNTGTATNAAVLEYRIIEDIIVYVSEYSSGGFQLAPGETFVVQVPANGSTWRLEADQEPNYPGNSLPSAVVEGCGLNAQGYFSTGFVSQFGENDADPFVSIDCRSNSDFTKAGFPLGVGEAHFISPGQDLEYLILFRNTGTDTVRQIIIRDTLSPWLDPLSVVPGAASHPYRFEMSGPGYLKWTFDPIALPDSHVNTATSEGFVKFRVQQKPDILPGTLIYNTASVYFDGGIPASTNMTFHRIDTGYIQYCYIQTNTGRELTIWPNPVAAGALIHIPEVPCGTVRLLDPGGRLLLEQPYSGGKLWLSQADRYPDGLYLLQVFAEDQWIGTGKVVLIH